MNILVVPLVLRNIRNRRYLVMRIEIHSFGGLGWPFTARGVKVLDGLMDAMSPYWDANVWSHTQSDDVYDAIIKRVNHHKDRPLIIAGGHSFGALAAIRLSRRLHQRGLEVAYLFGIDPTALPRGEPPMTIPPNVQSTDEFWSTAPFFNWPYGARRRDPKGGKGGMYVVPPAMKDTHKLFHIQGGHMGTVSSPITIKRITSRVKELVV